MFEVDVKNVTEGRGGGGPARFVVLIQKFRAFDKQHFKCMRTLGAYGPLVLGTENSEGRGGARLGVCG